MAAGETSLTLTYGPLLTTTTMATLDSGVVHDNVFSKDPLLNWLRTGKRVVIVSGGERLSLNIMFKKNETYGRYSGYDSLNTNPSIGQTKAFFNWQQAAVSVALSGLELRSNRGQSKVRDLQKEKMTQAEMSLVDGLATDAYSDGTATNQMAGLLAIIATTTTSGSYASIDSAVNTAWRNQIQASVGAGAVNLLPKLRILANSCSQGQGAQSAPDAYFTTQTVLETYESIVQPQVRYEQNPKGGADLGIQTLMFKGAPIMWDAYCQSQALYALNSQHIFFFVHKDANLTLSEGGFQKPINQDALVAQILFQGNMATNNRRKLGKLIGVT